MRWFRQVLSVLFLVVESLIWIVTWGRVISGDREPRLWDIALPVVLTLGGAFLVASTFSSSVTLFDDAIELRTLLGRKRLSFDQIRGRREYVSPNSRIATRYLRLEPNDDRLDAVEFEKSYTFDDEFYAWFNKLPDLDALDKKRQKGSNFGLI
jgi:hypothetical protein